MMNAGLPRRCVTCGDPVTLCSHADLHTEIERLRGLLIDLAWAVTDDYSPSQSRGKRTSKVLDRVRPVVQHNAHVTNQSGSTTTPPIDASHRQHGGVAPDA